jgi:NADPH-dependent ferric siderophore reductase
MTSGSFQEEWLGPAGDWATNADEYDTIAIIAADRAGLPRWVALRKHDASRLKAEEKERGNK